VRASGRRLVSRAVTVHRDEAPAFTEVRRRYQMRKAPIDDPAQLLYRIVDALVDSFFPVLADFDDRIDELENQTFLRASDEQLQEIFAMKPRHLRPPDPDQRPHRHLPRTCSRARWTSSSPPSRTGSTSS
jgi:CorA-like Mg2+ transporter protein